VHEASRQVKKEELLNLILMHYPLRACADKLGVTYITLCKWAKEPEFLNNLRVLSESLYTEVIAELREEKKSLKQQLTEASDKALKKLELLLDSAQEGIALKAADSILDRNAESARNRKVEGQFDNRYTMDPMTLMHAANTAREVEKSFERDGSKEE